MGRGNIATARLALKVRLTDETYHKIWEYLYVGTLQNQPAIVHLLLEHGIDANRVAYWNTGTETSRSWKDPSIDLLEEAIHVGSEPILS